MAAAVPLVVALGACGNDGTDGTEDADAPTSSAAPTAARYDESGPHEVEVDTWDVDGVGPVTVWYPAGDPEDASVAPAPFVVFAHGLALSTADLYDPLLRHLASWGAVVAAPERARNVDPVDVAASVRSAIPADDQVLAGLLEDDGPLVAAGHSAGTTEASEANLDSSVTGAVLLAGGGATSAVAAAETPVLVIAGGRDGTTDTWIRGNFDGVDGPHEVVVVEEAGHMSFSRLCTEPDGSDVPPIDCAPGDVGEAAVQPVIRHSLVAFVLWSAGQDATPAALGADVLASFGTPVTVEGSFADT